MTASLARTVRVAKALDAILQNWSTYMSRDTQVVVSRDGGSLVLVTVDVVVEGCCDQPQHAFGNDAITGPYQQFHRRHGIGSRVATSKAELEFAAIEAERDAFCEAAIRCGVDPAVLEAEPAPAAEPVAQGAPMSATMRVTRTRKQKEAIGAASND